VNPSASDFTLVDGALLVGLADVLPEVTDDFCRNARDDGAPDIGAVEYDGDVACDTTRPFGGAPPIPDPDPLPEPPKERGCQVNPGSRGSSLWVLVGLSLLIVLRRRA
jgi:MYXO-CTERM domain-containing protein